MDSPGQIDYRQMHAQYEADRMDEVFQKSEPRPFLGGIIVILFLVWLIA